MSPSTPKKLITVIGATGAQGFAVIEALLKPSSDGTPSPYSVRALTRNKTSERARELQARGVELIQGISELQLRKTHFSNLYCAGQFEDFKSVKKAFEGAYGAYVNTDGLTV